MAGQTAQIAQHLEHIQELEARLAKDRHNSSRPASSDPPFDGPPPPSPRERSGKPPSGQKGHSGAARALLDDAEQTMVVPLSGPCSCGPDRAESTRRLEPSGASASISWCAARSANSAP
nr:DUF6444 domain-containing protein [Thiorhodococcus minor]